MTTLWTKEARIEGNDWFVNHEIAEDLHDGIGDDLRVVEEMDTGDVYVEERNDADDVNEGWSQVGTVQNEYGDVEAGAKGLAGQLPPEYRIINIYEEPEMVIERRIEK